MIEIYDAVDRLVMVSPALKLEPVRYETDAELHHTSAEIGVTARDVVALHQIANLLGNHVRIYDESYTLRWWGLIEEVTLRTGGLEVTAGLDTMYNRVRVFYTYETPEGTQQGETDWLEDEESIGRYGVREQIVSVSGLNEAQATARRALELAKSAWPRRAVQVSAGEMSGTIRAVGYAQLLDRLYYQNLAGYEGHDFGDVELPLGWKLSSTLIGFEANKNKIHDFDLRLAGLTPGTKVDINGSSFNDGPRMVEKGPDILERVSATLANVDFDSSDDIRDAVVSNLDIFTPGEMIKVSGTTSNNKYWFIKTADANHMTVKFGDVTEEGPTSATIEQGHSVDMDAMPNSERPGPTITLEATGERFAQSFSFGEEYDWTVAEVWLHLRRTGTPTDDLTLGIYTDVSSAPGILIEEATYEDAADLSEVAGSWVRFEFSNTEELEYGTTYWLVLERDGAMSHNAVMVNISEETYARGTLKLWNGVSNAWETRASSTMAFQIWGKREALVQMRELVEQNEALAGLETVLDAGVESYQYQPEPELRALDRFRDLLRSGEENGERWLVRTTPERMIAIEAQRLDYESRYTLGPDGVVRHSTGAPVAGEMIAGEWLRLNDVPRFGDAGGADVLFVERCSYSAGQLQIEPADETYRLIAQADKLASELMPWMIRKLGRGVQ